MPLIVCAYHDQAMLALKLLYGGKFVNFTCGLPFVRTSPPHGTAFDIAGKNSADPVGMIEAVNLAITRRACGL
jgi:4-hydroxythreonine-4-phosphate dehydrogenase